MSSCHLRRTPLRMRDCLNAHSLGQRRGKSESAKIFQGLKANKTGLSKKLDTVLRNNHDMKIFGVGFVRSCANHAEYRHFMESHYHFYVALEDVFAKQCGDTSSMGRIWKSCRELHGAPEKLKADLAEVGVDAAQTTPSPATAAYVQNIRDASSQDAGQLLISHFYTRYLADLFGGSMLGVPTRAALNLGKESPQFYRFPSAVEDKRADYIEHVYSLINAEGDNLNDSQHTRLVTEARGAFEHNAAVYSERPQFYLGALLGGARIAKGLLARKLAGA
eukprot:TRINITY_DN122475_c0_g1_i1.p1 TRINITY_DN122475_c0_g1~~TRINITY_DN122475_c0_g1_i1.p1  ORF type:complete len:277 (+),score=67.00 TRINITY_DN122475_c0_g1_i1:86-916(+)